MGVIKKLNLHELAGYANKSNMEVYPITSTSAVYDENNNSLTDIISDLRRGGLGSGIRSKLLQAYITSASQPEAPSGGTYNFVTGIFNPPTGWKDSSAGLDYPIWVSYGTAINTSDSISWSSPVCIARNAASQGGVKAYVAIIYKNSADTPATPTGGSYDFDKGVLTLPDGWSKNTDIPVDEETWCSIRAFYTDSTITSWSEPVKVPQSKISLTAADIEAVAANMSFTATQLNYIVEHMELNADIINAVASKMTLTADQLKIVADNVDITGTLNTSDLTINNDKSYFGSDGSGYLAGGNIQWDKEGSTTINGKITATSGSIAGFKIEGDGLTNAGFKSDAYMILRNDTKGTYVGMGENIAPAGANINTTANFQNLNSIDSTGKINVAAYLNAQNSSIGNYAFFGTGNGVLDGNIVGYKLTTFTPTSSNNVIPMTGGNKILIKVANDYTEFFLPTITSVRNFLQITSTSTHFAMELYIMNSSSGYVYTSGYKASSTGNTNLPHLYKSGAEVDNIRQNTHEMITVLLTWDGSEYCAYKLAD